jgi:hypothetical protein
VTRLSRGSNPHCSRLFFFSFATTLTTGAKARGEKMAARRRRQGEVLVVSSSSSSSESDDGPPAPGPSRRHSFNNQVNAKNQRLNRRTEVSGMPKRARERPHALPSRADIEPNPQVPSLSRKSLNRPRAPPARSPSPDVFASSPPRREHNAARKRRKAWNESSSSEDDDDAHGKPGLACPSIALDESS